MGEKWGMILLFIALALVIAFSGCTQASEESGPTGAVVATEVEITASEPTVTQPAAIERSCPASCDDGDICTEDLCSAETNYDCKIRLKVPCCGNDLCEADENAFDCPGDCGDWEGVNCINLTCPNKCVGPTWYYDGLCDVVSEQCDYSMDKKAAKCGYEQSGEEAKPSSKVAYHRSYNDSDGYLYIIGEIENDGGSNLRGLKLNINLYSADDSLLSSHEVPSMLTILKPNTKSPFKLMVKPENFDNYDISIVHLKTLLSPRQKLIISGDAGAFDNTTYTITGNVENNDTETAEGVKIVAALYDEAGNILYAEKVLTSPANIETNSTATFEFVIKTSVFPEKMDTNYKLWVE